VCFYKGSSSAGARGSKRPYSAVIQSKPQGAVYGARNRLWSLERETYSTVRVTADSLLYAVNLVVLVTGKTTHNAAKVIIKDLSDDI